MAKITKAKMQERTLCIIASCVLILAVILVVKELIIHGAKKKDHFTEKDVRDYLQWESVSILTEREDYSECACRLTSKNKLTSSVFNFCVFDSNSSAEQFYEYFTNDLCDENEDLKGYACGVSPDVDIYTYVRIKENVVIYSYADEDKENEKKLEAILSGKEDIVFEYEGNVKKEILINFGE